MTQRVEKQIRPLAAIESERHFVKVGCEMLSTNVMPRTNDATLEQRERRFNSVSVNVAVNVHAPTTVDASVLRLHIVNGDRSLVCSEVVRHENLNVFAHVQSDVARQRTRSNILSVKQSQFAGTLN